MKTNEKGDICLGADEGCILRYMENSPDDFIAEMEIARRADGRAHFTKDAHWAHNALSQLVDAGLVEGVRVKAGSGPKKYLSPQLRGVLEHSNRKIDLSAYD